MRILSVRSTRRAGATRRRGLTVVEVLAALVVVSVGVLAMAGTSAMALRAGAAAIAERRAVARAQSRLAMLVASGCAGAASGASDAGADGIHERWVVFPSTGGAALVEAHVTWGQGTATHHVALRTALLC